MSHPHDHPWYRRPAVRTTGLVLGFVLLAAALVAVWRQRDVIDAALAAIAGAAPGRLVLLPLAVVANIVLTGLLFSVLMSRYGRVGLVEMQALIAASTLVNFLPLRPGLLGRVAYHRAVNGIPAVDGLKAIVQALALSSILAVYLALVALVSARLALPLWIGVTFPVPVLAAGLAVPRFAHWSRAAGLRYLDVLVWAMRYHVAFSLIGHPIDAGVALALACMSVVAMLVPFVSNGLGVREWAIGLFVPFVGNATLEVGLTAELVNRATEIVVVVVSGGAGIAWLRMRRGAVRRSAAPERPSS